MTPITSTFAGKIDCLVHIYRLWGAARSAGRVLRARRGSLLLTAGAIVLTSAACGDHRFTGCSGTGPVSFAQSPIRLDDVRYLLPYGLLAGAHVTPIDHMYFEPLDRSTARSVATCTRFARYRMV